MECCVCLDKKEEYIFDRKCNCKYYVCKECFDIIFNKNNNFSCVYCKIVQKSKESKESKFQYEFLYLDADERREFERSVNFN
jgi:hypothetical protein